MLCSAMEYSMDIFQRLEIMITLSGVYVENEMNLNNSSILQWQNPWLTDNVMNMDETIFYEYTQKIM